MIYKNLRDYIDDLAKRGELVRITEEVDPDQEITIIQHRFLAEKGPALLFENLKGYPGRRLVSNLYGTQERTNLVFGKHPGEIGNDLVSLATDLMPPTIGKLWENRNKIFRIINSRMRSVSSCPVLENIEEPAHLNQLPVLTCWPLDGGPFFTLPLVHTEHPENGTGNLGIYRLQRFDDTSAGMHWQIEKGGGFHFKVASALNRKLPISVILGGPPALTMAAIAPLPEGIDERLLAALILGAPLNMIKRKQTGHRIPSQAEFVLEGSVTPGDVRKEGPFGDHLGHYSHSANFPVFRVDRILSRKDAIYPATVVGKPPQEDYYIGCALQEMTIPLLKFMHKGISDLWAYPETGFHPLAVASVNERYTHEALKHAFAILGEGQLSLTKILMVVGSDCKDIKDFRNVSRSLWRNLDPITGIHLIAPTAQDTLDFTGPTMNIGSRLILIAPDRGNPIRTNLPPNPPKATDVHKNIKKIVALGESFLIAQVDRSFDRESVIAALKANGASLKYLFHVLVSDDVDLESTMSMLWGWFTRFDPLKDIHPDGIKLDGNRAVFQFPICIDASWKTGYRKPVEFDPEIVKNVDKKWDKILSQSKIK
ncbi:UbiD family decarboxylase [Candidatus Saganbacteria bacterium]|nr:UbiD family decarboxylase [Candidatus Saganbacteria bacterium]